ncbi:MAG: NAD(P)/FAD-dependent oxidoreductase [Gammaproteobacteria bacterium]|nr:MAG: NAD(P)/FAD-dependent oxidoreductase [Gammaproteobacteria bacterium]
MPPDPARRRRAFRAREPVSSVNPASGVIATECVIVGAGPAGLFMAFELGLLGIGCQIVDSLSQPGGQCIELYPDKPIYDIPAVPVCTARELIDRLLEQIRPFAPGLHLGEEVATLQRGDGGRFLVTTSAGTRFDAGAVVIAAGIGSFQPRRLAVPGAADLEGRCLHYRVQRAADFAGQDLLIAGGGDSALDWTLELAIRARSLTLVHRRAEFRAQPASVARMRELAATGHLRQLEGQVTGLSFASQRLTAAQVTGPDGVVEVPCQQLLVFFGLHQRLGPIADWGLEMAKRAIRVDTEKFGTSIPGIFAIGDINTYPGKKKLILSGFHEAALAAFGVQHHLCPEQRQFLQYTTTSPALLARLGVPKPD